jgi:hypothetical protein
MARVAHWDRHRCNTDRHQTLVSWLGMHLAGDVQMAMRVCMPACLPQVERAAATHFGIKAYGVHVNGWVWVSVRLVLGWRAHVLWSAHLQQLDLTCSVSLDVTLTSHPSPALVWTPCASPNAVQCA